MGKAKKRNFNKNTDIIGSVIKRKTVVDDVICAIKNNNFSTDIKNNITLFGITAEELLEAGASIEEISAVKNVLN